MIKLGKLIQEMESEEDIKSKYPKCGQRVDGREYNTSVPNMSSIGASFTHYKILSGIREVSMSDLTDDPKKVLYAANDFDRAEKLAEEIRESKFITPLIIAIDNEGPYILEGCHRFVALLYLKANSFPAVVVLDLDK